MRRPLLIAVVTLLLGAAAPSPPSMQVTWVTLGTQGGPVPSVTRSQPANLLLAGDDANLVDVGDGAAGRLAAAGVPLVKLRRVFISHLHFDHTGGLGAILGLRYAVNAPGVLDIYGPPGTAALVAGLAASMQPTSEAGYGVAGESNRPPASTVRVIELSGGERLDIAGMTVTTAANSHYSFPAGSPLAARYRSLSYRFDLPGKSIAYTGDTGPSAAVETLARGADLLVAEMIDLPATLAGIRAQRPDMPPAMVDQMTRHLTDHHLTPSQVGQMAARAGIKALAVTHLVGAPDAESSARYASEIRQSFRGTIMIASDLDQF